MFKVRRVVTVVGVLGLLPADAAQAYFFTGNELYDICIQQGGTAAKPDIRATLFAAAVLDTMLTMVEGVKAPKLACLTSEVTAGQAGAIACTYLERNPEIRHYSAASNVLAALQRAFPCKASNP